MLSKPVYLVSESFSMRLGILRVTTHYFAHNILLWTCRSLLVWNAQSSVKDQYSQRAKKHQLLFSWHFCINYLWKLHKTTNVFASSKIKRLAVCLETVCLCVWSLCVGVAYIADLHVSVLWDFCFTSCCLHPFQNTLMGDENFWQLETIF